MLDLTGRTVVVTGGNGGIGLGLARDVARAGARVAIRARDRAKTDAATKDLGQGGVGALVRSLGRLHPDRRRLLDLPTARQSSRAARTIALRPSGSSTRA